MVRIPKRQRNVREGKEETPLKQQLILRKIFKIERNSNTGGVGDNFSVPYGESCEPAANKEMKTTAGILIVDVQAGEYSKMKKQS